jgi:site-specific recombinase XerD
MSELRQRMIDQMTLRGFSPRTHESYLEAVTGLARYYKQSPDQLSAEQVRQYLLYLERERHLAWSSLNVAASGLRFLYFDTLKWEPVKLEIPPRTTPKRLPEVLSREEVDRLISSVLNLKHRTLLMTIYAAGLRVGEAVSLRIGARQRSHDHPRCAGKGTQGPLHGSVATLVGKSAALLETISPEGVLV